MLPYLDGALRRDLPRVVEAVVADVANDKDAALKTKEVGELQTQILSEFDALCAKMKTPETITWCTKTPLLDGACGDVCHHEPSDARCPRAG